MCEGTVTRNQHLLTKRRFIPACAGNSPISTKAPRSASVHPRVCGEQETFTSGIGSALGSSPRVRGTDRPIGLFRQPGRFIPACAGNRSSPEDSSSRQPVHPRVCGEQTAVVVSEVPGPGSSPRVRGTGCTQGSRWPGRRFIPACAGNRKSTLAEKIAESVHPRVCGEQPVLKSLPPL